MANVDLKSLTIQGLDDTYIIPQNLNEMAGTLDVDKGGTGVNSVEDLKEVLNIGDVASENVVPISKGGLNSTNIAQARANLGIADYIVEQGENYAKWASGKAECWGSITLLSGFTNRYISVSLPINLVGDYKVSLTPYYNGSIISRHWCGAQNGSTVKNSDSFGLSAITTTTNYEIGFDWAVIGYWK